MGKIEPKTHFALAGVSPDRYLSPLCGSKGEVKLDRNLEAVNCRRCLHRYANDNSWKATLEERVEEVFDLHRKEVRTTSSTGGQKGVKLARFSLIPTGPLWELAEHFGKGASKYAEHQWRAGYEWSKSYDAINRHNSDFWSGKDYDVCSNNPEGCQHVDSEGQPFNSGRDDTCYNHTGSHHMVAVAWHALVLLEFRNTHPEHDDRYIAKG